MIKIKTGVKPTSLLILAAISNVAESWGITVTITSGNDSTHMKGSRHYSDSAIDIRSKTFADSSEKRAFMQKVLERLGPKFTAILEDEGKPNEHIHFELN